MPTSRSKFLYPSGSKPLDGYTIKRGIGIGGFGEVYFALSDAGKEVALKRIQRNLDVELRGVRQCLNLKHVNLISLWDIRTNDAGESWVVMEYVPGASLRDMLERYPDGMPEDQVKLWFASTAAGVAYLHDRGIVHRDLKPANIFRDEDEQVIKIGDYGLSKFISCSRRSGQTESVGTFHYMAPEIGKGVYGKEIDVYAMGIILFEMLTGRVPYEGESSQEIIMKHLTAQPDLQGVPEGFVKPIQRCLVKDPDERYSNIPELLRDLPWPDLAEEGEKIVNRNAIGPIGQTKEPERELPPPTAKEKSKIQPLLLRDKFNRSEHEDIVFGDMRDSSAGVQRNRNSIVPVVSSVEVVSAEVSTSPGRDREAAATADSTSTPLHITDDQEGLSWSGLFSLPTKLTILAVGTVLLTANSSYVLPSVLGIGLCFLGYHAVMSWLARPDHDVNAAKRKSIYNEEELKAFRDHLSEKDFGDRTAELLGSLLTASVVSFAFCASALLIGGQVFDINLSIESVALCVWLAIVSSLGSWALLITGSLWEKRDGDPWTRRVVTAVMGAIVGALGFLIASSLGVELENMRTMADTVGGKAIPQLDLSLFPAFVLFFVAVFGVLRWWQKIDPVRENRISLSFIAICLICSVLAGHLMNFNPIYNAVIAIAISTSVQLTSPWLNSATRAEVQQANS